MNRWFALVFATVLLGGCSTGTRSVGHPLPFGSSVEDFLQIGQTTREEVLFLFGSPTVISTNQDGDVFRYLYTHHAESGLDIGLSAFWGALSLSLFRSENEQKSTENLTVFFGDTGELLAWSYTPIEASGY